MTRRVAVLTGPIVDQIAAGEVVERPASVVKELIENALDAGASAIAVDLEDGGRRRIVVADDGFGMSPEDARLCVERHATSKIRTVEDLAAIGTLGFRGEALPSIASVSSLRLETRSAGDEAGTAIDVVAGVRTGEAVIGRSIGTTVDVRDLFANVPARLKFLRSKATEAGAVYDVVLRAALAHPSVRFVVSHEGRRIHTYAARPSMAERAAEVLPDEELTAVSASAEGVEIEAYVAAPERARSGTRALHAFVNGRPVHDLKLARAVAYAYRSVMPPGKYPVGVVHLRVPLDEVDVNAHPQKAEVRFARGSTFYETVTKALARKLGVRAFAPPAARPDDYWDTRLGTKRVRDAAQGTDEPATADAATGRSRTSPTPSVGGAVRAAPDANVRPASSGVEGFLAALTASAGSAAPAPVPFEPGHAAAPLATGAVLVRDADPPAASSSTPRAGAFSGLRFLAQVRTLFLVCEAHDGLVVLDQHAASERVVYAGMRAAIASRRVERQALLFPERVEVRAEDAERLEAHAAEAEAMGLEFGRLGPTTVAVHAVPRLLARANPRQLLLDLVAELTREGERLFGDAFDTAVATMACHAAIRAGQLLAPEECVELLRALDAAGDFAGHCPHGRPVRVHLPFAELERKLGR